MSVLQLLTRAPTTVADIASDVRFPIGVLGLLVLTASVYTILSAGS